MKHLNKKSSAVLQKLIDCMSDPTYAKTMGSFAKIEKADSCFMPVSIEKLHHIPTFDNHIAVSHTYGNLYQYLFDRNSDCFCLKISE